MLWTNTNRGHIITTPGNWDHIHRRRYVQCLLILLVPIMLIIRKDGRLAKRVSEVCTFIHRHLFCCYCYIYCYINYVCSSLFSGLKISQKLSIGFVCYHGFNISLQVIPPSKFWTMRKSKQWRFQASSAERCWMRLPKRLILVWQPMKLIALFMRLVSNGTVTQAQWTITISRHLAAHRSTKLFAMAYRTQDHCRYFSNIAWRLNQASTQSNVVVDSLLLFFFFF